MLTLYCFHILALTHLSPLATLYQAYETKRRTSNFNPRLLHIEVTRGSTLTAESKILGDCRHDVIQTTLIFR